MPKIQPDIKFLRKKVVPYLTPAGQKRIPSREGGIEIVVEELSTRMVVAGHSVTCLNRKGEHVSGGEVCHVNNYKGVEIKEVFTVDRKGLAAMTSSLFACICASIGKYDVVHIHAEGPAFFSFIPKLFGKRVYVTVHGTCEIIVATKEKPVKSRFYDSLVAHHNSNTTCELESLVISKNSRCTISKRLLDSRNSLLVA